MSNSEAASQIILLNSVRLLAKHKPLEFLAKK